MDNSECPEDEISVNLIEVIATYAATKICTILALYMLNFVIKNKILGKSDFRKEFYISVESVWLFGF